MGLLDGKKALIFGVANDHSIAWAIAQALHREGAELGFTYVNESIERRVRPLAESLGASVVLPCDVSKDEDIAGTFDAIKERWGRVDIVIHAVPFALREELKGRMLNTSRAGFHLALDVSVYSLIAIARCAEPLMGAGASLLTLSYLGAERVVPNYNVMGVAKAALVGRLFSVVVSAAVQFFPLMVLHKAYGFGTQQLPAPQAGLMALMTQGIVGGEMAWPLVIVGIVMGIAMILIKVKSPMLFSVGMYLPLETTFAIFVGGIFRWIVDKLVLKRRYNDAQKARVENAGILTAAGLIAGEALIGLFVALVIFLRNKGTPESARFWYWEGFSSWAVYLAIPVFLILALYMIFAPLRKAGAADEPAPPTAVM